jgi:ornithine cyclodeaminase/alanine dehydrogenase-like protein (mu-crystallin family)
MAENTHVVHKFSSGFAYGLDTKQATSFANSLSSDLGYPVTVCNTAEEAVRQADVIFTQTPASEQVLKLEWLKPNATIIARYSACYTFQIYFFLTVATLSMYRSGSDQPTKNEIPADVMAKSKFIADLVRQCSRVGELRTAIEQGTMKESDVYAEIGEVVNGTKKGRVPGDGIIVVDLTGTGAQDAAIGQVAWDALRNL